jgi:RimJ/RimL family protein N-acetyltransferase
MRVERMDENQARQFLSTISYSPTGHFKGIVQLNDYYEIVAAVGYDHWTPNSVQLHIWIPRPAEMCRTFLREGFRYPFEIGRKGLVVGLTPSNNAAALNFNRRVGFKEVYRMKDAWDKGVDVVVQEMRKENCRWLRRSHELVLEEAKEGHQDS